MSMRFLLLSALVTAMAAGDGTHNHDEHGEECGCASRHAAHPFTISCPPDADAEIDAAMVELAKCAKTTAACSAVDPTTGGQTCQIAFFTLQAVHDHCPHGELSAAHDAMVHDYEAFCHSCTISRAFDPTMIATCPTVDCADTALPATAFDTLNKSCTSGTCCVSQPERGAYEILTAYHDQCEHDTIPTHMERARHEHEQSCKAALCNAVGPDYNASYCPDLDGPKVHHNPSPPPSAGAPQPGGGDGSALDLSEWPLWVDGLYAIGVWLIIFGIALLVTLICVARDASAIRRIATRRSGASASPVFTTISTEMAGGARAQPAGGRV